MFTSTLIKLRVARATNDLNALLPFYVKGLGLDVLTRFEDHQGFDGMMLGSPSAPYHFEFTREHGVLAPKAPSADAMLVFYLPEASDYLLLCQQMDAAGAKKVYPNNPYWAKQGQTYEDPDGYRVVLQHAAWTL